MPLLLPGAGKICISIKMKRSIFEFREYDVLFSFGLFERKIRYVDIVSAEKRNYFEILVRSFHPFKRALVSMPMGISWSCLLIEAKDYRSR